MNEAIAGPGAPPRKRPGDNIYNNNKKRRKNETPPPSRRPQGPPNVPPSRPVTPPVKVANARQLGSMREIIALNEVLEDKVDLDELKEIDRFDKDDRTEKILENGLSPEKKPSGKSVNKQLRKMQEMHKNKLCKGMKNKSETKLTSDESSSPILSILRTSFASEDMANTQESGEEIEVDVVVKRKQEPTRKDETGSKRGHADVPPTRQPLSARKCQLLLHNYHNTKLRMKAWKDIRNIKGIHIAPLFLAVLLRLYLNAMQYSQESAKPGKLGN